MGQAEAEVKAAATVEAEVAWERVVDGVLSLV